MTEKSCFGLRAAEWGIGHRGQRQQVRTPVGVTFCGAAEQFGGS